jgi:broad specificity phosphatase PhoE
MRIILFLLLALFFMSFANCKKETRVETVTKTDTVYVQVRDTTFIPALISDTTTTTTFIVLRHAEKEAAGADPVLTSDGIARADELNHILSSVPVAAIYSTPFNRTRQTVQPLAVVKNLTIKEYQPSVPTKQLVDDIISANRGKVVTVVGHSNTVPEILKELSKNTFNVSIAETQYDNLFIVSIPEKLTPTITHIKYGKSTP